MGYDWDAFGLWKAGQDLPPSSVLLDGGFKVDASDVEWEGYHSRGNWARCPSFPEDSQTSTIITVRFSAKIAQAYRMIVC